MPENRMSPYEKYAAANPEQVKIRKLEKELLELKAANYDLQKENEQLRKQISDFD